MPIAKSGPVEGEENYFYAVYDTSMTMSTYLIALVISDYDMSTVGYTSKTNTLVRVAGPLGAKNSGILEYALDCSLNAIDFFSEYYGFNYSEPFGASGSKSDQFGIPGGTVSAMENWGLITYDFTYLYTDIINSYEEQVMWVANTVGHELQHMWTGNLITTSWWDEVWVSEAFAEYGGFMALQSIEPEWNWQSEFVDYDLWAGLDYDGNVHSRPLINKQNNNGQKVETFLEIVDQFDDIAYAKGACIVRMMVYVMKEWKWQYGMQQYLNEMKFGLTDGSIYFK